MKQQLSIINAEKETPQWIESLTDLAYCIESLRAHHSEIMKQASVKL